jgi:hypothetical protein
MALDAQKILSQLGVKPGSDPYAELFNDKRLPPCLTCGKGIAPSAETCPFCGAGPYPTMPPNQFLGRLLVAFAVIACLLGLLGAIGSGH